MHQAVAFQVYQILGHDYITIIVETTQVFAKHFAQSISFQITSNNIDLTNCLLTNTVVLVGIACGKLKRLKMFFPASQNGIPLKQCAEGLFTSLSMIFNPSLADSHAPAGGKLVTITS